MSLIKPIFIFNSVENKGEMTFKSNVCKAWFAVYSEVQIGNCWSNVGSVMSRIAHSLS